MVIFLVKKRRNSSKRKPLEIPRPIPEQFRRRAREIDAERAARQPVPMLGRISFDTWSEWFIQQDHPFARAWSDYYPTPERRAGGSLPAPATIEQLRELAPDAREHFLQAQRDAIEDARRAIQNSDGLTLLSILLLKTQFAPWGSDREDLELSPELDLELASQEVLAQRSTESVSTDPLQIGAALSLIERVRLLACAVNVAEGFLSTAEDYENLSNQGHIGDDQNVRNYLLMRRLMHRGAAYGVHARQLSLALGRTYEDSLVKRVGFSVRDMIALADGVLSLWRERIPAAFDHAAWLVNTAEANVEDPALKPLVQHAAILAGTKEYLIPNLAPHVDELGQRLPEPTRSRLDALISRLSLRPGQGQQLRSALDEPVTRERPFILFDDTLSNTSNNETRLLAANTRALTTDMVSTVEALLAREFSQGWSAARANAVDSYAVEILASRLPGCRAFTSVYVDLSDGPGRFEIDGLILFDDSVLFIEGKGAPFKLAGRRGSVDNYRSQVKNLIGGGAKQLARDAFLLQQRSPFPVTDRSGNVLTIFDPTSIRRSFQILPCLDSLGDVGTNLRLLDEWGIVPPDESPWIVALTDMRIVIDALRGPAELVAYLDWRRRWVRDPRIIIIDEIEMFTLFQRAVDMRLKLRDISEDRVMFASGQPAFDDYYAGLEGSGPRSEQPRLRLTPRFRRFVGELQRVRPERWLGAAAVALQAPESIQVTFDRREIERDLAASTHRDGVVVRGADDFRIIVINQHLTWPEVYADGGVAASYADADLVFLCRAVGSRIRLEWACRGDEVDPPPRWCA